MTIQRETHAIMNLHGPRTPEHRRVTQRAPSDLSSHWAANITDYKDQHAKHRVLSAVSLSDYKPTYSA